MPIEPENEANFPPASWGSGELCRPPASRRENSETPTFTYETPVQYL
jgi:hypothetical protein